MVDLVCTIFQLQDSRGGSKKNDPQCKPTDHDEASKTYLKFQGTRKLDCPAQMQVRGIKIFPDYEVKECNCQTANSLKLAKKKVLDRLKNDMSSAMTINTAMHYHLKIPLSTEHQGHPIGVSASINHCVDRRIINKIYDLVGKGVTRPDEVRRCLEEYVEREMFATLSPQERPKKSNRKYYPTRQDLRNHITKAIAASKYCKDDQESLRQKVLEWQTAGTGKFLYRPKGREADNTTGKESPCTEKFLFVHQEVWQQRLLRRYGSELVLLDATYKTTKYALPLFFLCVHTNVGYKVVSEFICEIEDADSIAEALSVIKGWNDWWMPSFFMVDYSTAEINAIEKEFPNASVYICDFHRIQAWNRWVRSGKSGLDSQQQEILIALLQRVATAREASAHKTAVAKLRNAALYKTNKHVQEYVENVWMSCVERWAKAFRTQQVLNIVNTNNGVEAQNKHFKYDYLPRSVDKSVFGIAVLLVESFIPDSYQHYLDTNFKLSSRYRKFKDNIPCYLRNRPAHFIKHCIRSKFQADEFRESDVDCVDLVQGEFRVRSAGDVKIEYTVQLEIPSCTCEAWLKTHFPCKHFFAVFNAYEEWDFPRLPYTYLNNVFITLDNIGFEERGEDFRQQSEEEVDSMDIDEAETEDDSTSQDHDVPSTDSPCDYKNISYGFSSERSDCKSNRETSRNINSDPSVAKLRTQVRETAGLVRDATYHVTNIDCLKEAMEALKKIHQSLMCNSLREGGLPIRSSPAKKRLKVTSLDYHKVFHKKLPLRRKRKIRVKSKKNAKAENIPVVDLTCSSPLPSGDQVGIYAGTHVHTRLSTKYQIPS